MAARPDITPLSIARDAPGVVLFGGTFDPPHRWHTAVPRAARDAMFGPLGWIVFIPAARSPLKASGPVVSDAQRIDMLRLAIRELPNAAVWTDEIDRAGGGGCGGPSYTIDTVRRVLELHPGMPLRLLIGADQAAAFHQWKDYRRLMELAEPCVALRPPIDTPAKLATHLDKAGVWEDEEIEAWTARIVPGAVWDVSSTAIRQALARSDKAAKDRLGLWIEPAVAQYIETNGLYRSR